MIGRRRRRRRRGRREEPRVTTDASSGGSTVRRGASASHQVDVLSALPRLDAAAVGGSSISCLPTPTTPAARASRQSVGERGAGSWWRASPRSASNSTSRTRTKMSRGLRRRQRAAEARAAEDGERARPVEADSAARPRARRERRDGRDDHALLEAGDPADAWPRRCCGTARRSFGGASTPARPAEQRPPPAPPRPRGGGKDKYIWRERGAIQPSAISTRWLRTSRPTSRHATSHETQHRPSSASARAAPPRERPAGARAASGRAGRREGGARVEQARRRCERQHGVEDLACEELDAARESGCVSSGER